MPQQPLKVLFADDSATMRKVAEITFASDDFDLVLLGGGADVVASVKKNQPGVVILDADMPDVNGYDACRQLRGDAGTAGVPVLLLSGPSSPFDERKANQAGVSDHIDKPFESQAMFDKLPEAHKKLVVRGAIVEGMSRDAVFLAWGRPSRVSRGSRDGGTFERWIYTHYEPVWTHNSSIGLGYGYGRYGCRYGGLYNDGPSVTYIPYNAAKVEFVSGRVKAWEALN